MLARFRSMPGSRKRVRSFSATAVRPSQPQVGFRVVRFHRDGLLERLGSLLVIGRPIVVPPHQFVHGGVLRGNRLQNFKRLVELRETVEFTRLIELRARAPNRRPNAKKKKRKPAHTVAFTLEVSHSGSAIG